MLNFILLFFTKKAQYVEILKPIGFKGFFKYYKSTKCKIIDEMQEIIVKKHEKIFFIKN